jgi:diguanylate cyclase (GGDEF)-like protein
MNNNHDQDDALFFVDEDPDHLQTDSNSEHASWNILIIDDDPDVHSSTMFALNGIKIQGRSLHFLHAYSTAEARQVLLHSKNIAVILLDVVMDADDAGLQLVNYIRVTLAMSETRIILRTGQAGYAPEMDAIRDYDINDYKNKTELTQAKLFTTATSAIRSYDQICTISASKKGLELIIRSSAELMTFTDLKKFSIAITSYLSELLDVDAESFICLSHPTQDLLLSDNEKLSGLRVISGTEKYQLWVDQLFSHIADKAQQTPVQKALFERTHTYNTDSTVFYFGNIGGASLALYFDKGIQTKRLDLHLLDMFCSNISVCLDNVILKSRMHNLAFFDPLTGLANRLQLLQNLHETLNSPKKNESALALIDIDHFAETNDALGHQFGDFLLCSIGKRLHSHFGDSCQIARIGNDIFALLGHEEMVAPNMILGLFSQPFVADKQQVQLSATLGLIKFSEYELSGSEALKDANISLKRAKKNHRSGYSFFTRDMGVEIRERVRMMHALRTAFEGERLFVVYQPQVDMTTGRTTGTEALLRWKTEDGTFVPPDQFIPIAEYSGLIINIGEWVLRTACFELMQLRALGHLDLQMAVNVSQSQFSHPLFLQSVERALHDSKVPAHKIELEITESMAMTDPELLISTLKKLKNLGLRISIDDFGTGFSSLSHLQKLNVDKLKIDRAFVTEISHREAEGSIAKMIVQLSQSLNLDIIAEGVETEQQAQALMSFGCNYAQGFLYSRPKTKTDLHIWLREESQLGKH